MNAVNSFSLRRIKHIDIIHPLKAQLFRKTTALPSHLHSVTCSSSELWKRRKDSSELNLLPLSHTLSWKDIYHTVPLPLKKIMINFHKEKTKKKSELWVKHNEIGVKKFQWTLALNNGIPLPQNLWPFHKAQLEKQVQASTTEEKFSFKERGSSRNMQKTCRQMTSNSSNQLETISDH